MIIGRSIGETTLVDLTFISKDMPRVGEYVTLNYDGKIVLGMIESMVRGSVSLNNEIYDPDTIDKIRQIEGNDYYIKGNIRILGDVNDNLKLPRTPAPPGTEIEQASTEILKKVFDQDNSLDLGHLISQEEVQVGVDLNKMVSRHLAILAMTGAGKSNTVAVLVDELLKQNGCMFIFDMHSEYINAEFSNGEVNPIKPIINPKYMEFSEIKQLANIGSNAVNQERYFRKAFKQAKEELEHGEAKTPDFLEQLLIILNSWEMDDERPTKERNNIIDVINKIEDLQSIYGKLLDTNTGNILTQLKPHMCNVLDLGQVDENTAEVIVSHVLRNALKSRKKFIHENDDDALDIPVFFILEEAHILAPQNRNTKCKYWITRIAREGRKFGLGLCMVSQSPKSVDNETLSQANNMIILRLVEPKDQQHVQSSSESLSDDLVKQLPGLNVGEALVLGMMTKIPTLVKINSFKGKTHGGDLDVRGLWNQDKQSKDEELIRMEEELNDLGGIY